MLRVVCALQGVRMLVLNRLDNSISFDHIVRQISAWGDLSFTDPCFSSAILMQAKRQGHARLTFGKRSKGHIALKQPMHSQITCLGLSGGMENLTPCLFVRAGRHLQRRSGSGIC